MDNDDLVELLTNRIETSVKKRVEADLFRYYRNLASIVVLVLGVFGYTVGWPALMDRVDDQIETQISNQIEKPVGDAIKRANEAALKAEELAEKHVPEIEGKQKTLQISLGSLEPRFDDFYREIGATTHKLARLNETADKLSERHRELQRQVLVAPVKREEMADLEKRLNTLIGQVQEINDSVIRVSTTASLEAPKTNELAALADQQAIIVDNTLADLGNVRKNSIVFVQFAGGRRADIEAVSARLRNKYWNVPEEERLKSAAGKQEIRYFYADDERAAQSLSADLTTALLDVGFPHMDIAVKKLNPDNFSSRPQQGILEVWVEIPLNRSK